MVQVILRWASRKRIHCLPPHPVIHRCKIKEFSQWFAGKINNIADALSWDWHKDDKELTSTFRLFFPQQMPMHFGISPLPSKISSWLILLLQRLPINACLQEEHTMTRLDLGHNEKSNAS
jgi:hypothetical protein